MSSLKNYSGATLAQKYARQNEAISIAMESVQAERDEYRYLHSAVSEKLEAAQQRIAELEARVHAGRSVKGSWQDRAWTAEEEIARRDQAAREPVGVLEDVMGGRGANAYRFRANKNAVLHYGMPLFAAQPAALPPTDEQLKSAVRAWNVREYPDTQTYRAMRKALGFTVEGE